MPNGIIIIDKPAGWTSMDVCAKLRGILHEKRVGHAGTLDPMATGVLPVFVGQATKAVSFAENGRKVYEAVLLLGRVTDTQDTSGETLEERAVTVTADDVAAALPRFLGEIEQIPPMYSAIKVNGQKLYDLARQGKEVARKPRRITIYGLALTEDMGGGRYALRVECSKGTYIRPLCHEIGEKQGCHGCMEQLIRTRVGQFDRNGAHTLDEIAAIVGEGRLSEILVPVDEMFAALRSFATADDHAKKLAENGNPLKPAQIREIGETASGGDFAEDEEFRLYLDDGTFVGIYQYRPSQNLTRPVKLFLERT